MAGTPRAAKTRAGNCRRHLRSLLATSQACRGTCEVADEVNRLGRLDVVIHNAGIGYREGGWAETEDGVPEMFAVNVLAPYVLTVLIQRPPRLVYLSSGKHRSAAAQLDDIAWKRRPWSGPTAYAESKLYDVLLAFAAARPTCARTR